MKKIFFVFTLSVSLIYLGANLSSCKSCKKEEPKTEVTADTASHIQIPENMLNMPHADTSLIPVLSAVIDNAFEASAKKDYDKLAKCIVYRGPNEQKMGYDVFDSKNKYDRAVVKITADVFNKWSTGVEAREYGRAFALPQPDGRDLPVLEVIFTTPTHFDRKFFGFLLIKDEWKIADVSSNLGE